MFKKFAQCLLLGVFVAALNGCATTDDAGSLVEDPLNGGSTGSEDGILEDGAVIVGENYDSYNDGLHLTDVQRAKLQALKQDGTIYFGYDRDDIPDRYVSLLQAHAEFLMSAPEVKIIIEGHTDERGTPEYNIALGERRARSVARYLLNLGVTPDQISIVSYGEEKPHSFGHGESAWSKNRRAVISY